MGNEVVDDVVPVKPKRKKPVPNTPVAMKRYKKEMLVLLANGSSPGEAAEIMDVSRSMLYAWRRDDLVFAEEWKNAVETTLDKIESGVQRRALAGDKDDSYFILKYRRYNQPTYHTPPQNNFIMNVSLAEHTKRLERLGLAVPMIASDLEDEDVTIIEADNDGSGTTS